MNTLQKWYEVHQVNDGVIEEGYFAHDGYSQYYKNKMRYNLSDAKAHIAELKEGTTLSREFVILHCVMVKSVIEE